jgi:hypothetical protein
MKERERSPRSPLARRYASPLRAHRDLRRVAMNKAPRPLGLPTTAALFAALVLAQAALGPPVVAQRSLEIQEFDVRVQVQEDASIRVMESIQVRFNGSWRGFFRTIPVEYRTPQGFSFRLFFHLESVTDESGRSLETDVSRERSYRKIKIWVPDAHDVTRTITLQYTIPNALKFFEEHDELYWNVTGTEWDIPIHRAVAIVELPDGASGLRATAFTGAYGSAAKDAAIKELERGFYFETVGGLSFREGLTVVVGWDPGLVRRPGIAAKARMFLLANWLFFLPLLSLLGMYWVWRTWGKDPERRSVAPAYEPPDGMTPAEVGTLVDNRPDPRDITATLVDLAVKGHIRIEEMETKALFGIIKNSDYRFVRLTNTTDWSALKPHERLFLNGLFDLTGFEGGLEKRVLREPL